MRIVVIILLAIIGFIGLGMSLCGGMFTLSGLAESGHGGEFPASSFLIISVPSLIVGVLIVIAVVRALRRRLSPPADAKRQGSDEAR